MDMTIEWIDEILFPERDDKGRPAFLAKLSSMQAPSTGQSIDPVEVIRRKMWAHGIPPYQIDQEVNRLKQRQKEIQQLMYTRPKPQTKEQVEAEEQARQKRIEEYLAKQ